MPEKFTIEEFAKRIKAKYPQYGNLSDHDLVGKMIAKYPKYRDNIIPEGRKAAAFSDAEKNKPAFEKPGGEPALKSILDAPLDVGIGIEQAVGIDPMHPISSLPGAIGGLIRGGVNLLAEASGGPVGQFKAAGSMIVPAVEAVQEGGQAIREQNRPAALQAVGRGYAAAEPLVEGVTSLAKPTIAELREEATAAGVPEKLQARAASNKVPLGRQPWQERALVVAPSSAVGYAIGGPVGAAVGAAGSEALALLRRSDWYRGAKAKMLERTARELVDPNAKPRPVQETTIAQRPDVPIKDAPRMREVSPLDVESKSAAGPRQEIPIKNAPRMGEVSPLETGTKTPAGPRREIEFTPGSEPAGSQPNMKSIEEKIAPSGAKARQKSQMVDANGQTTPFGRTLLENVPELATATKGAKADAALMSGYQRVLQRVAETENAIPQNATVEKVSIISKLGELEAEYIEKGLTKTAESIERIKNDWLETGAHNQIQWSEFIRRKRAFFQEHNLSSAPFRRAYGILIEASNRVSPELSQANQAYSAVRRALDNAKIDVNTGRRILDVGKESKGKPTVSQMIEQSKPKTQRAPEPVKTRQEALDLLSEPEPAEEDITPPGAASQPLTKPDSVATAKIGAAIPNPDVDASASSDMQIFARDVRDMQGVREGKSGGGATTMESNAYGKEIEENVSDEWSKVGKSLGVQPPAGLEAMSPGRIAKAIERGKGADYERVKKTFTDAAREGFSIYRQSQRESGVGPGVLRERALSLMRRRLEQP